MPCCAVPSCHQLRARARVSLRFFGHPPSAKFGLHVLERRRSASHADAVTMPADSSNPPSSADGPSASTHSVPPAPVHANPAPNPPPPPPPLPRRNDDPAILEFPEQFGAVRDRLFHALLVRTALCYAQHVGRLGRLLIESAALLAAVLMLLSLLFVQITVHRLNSTCLDQFQASWPREGILRVEVIRNLKTLDHKEQYMKEMQQWVAKTYPLNAVCQFNVKDVLRYGPSAMPAEVRQRRIEVKQERAVAERNSYGSLLDYVLAYTGTDEEEEEDEEEEFIDMTDRIDMYKKRQKILHAIEEDFDRKIAPEHRPSYLFIAEYSLLYGLLRLPHDFLVHHRIEKMSVRIDMDAPCFGDTWWKRVAYGIMGYEEAIIANLRKLSKGEADSGKRVSFGYLHDLQTDEHFHFVSVASSKIGYISTFFLMVIFTFAISMLLRFSHHQIFMFIVDMLRMFELQQHVVFPAGSLLTVILALIGMEAIMSEVFNDTTIAFYIILIVWVADQYDAICCNSPASKKHWLRFFFLYHYLFYAYQYRLGGQYGVFALFTSTLFILHSMIFFFHRYELPLILATHRLDNDVVQPRPVETQNRPVEQPEQRHDMWTEFRRIWMPFSIAGFLIWEEAMARLRGWGPGRFMRIPRAGNNGNDIYAVVRMRWIPRTAIPQQAQAQLSDLQPPVVAPAPPPPPAASQPPASQPPPAQAADNSTAASSPSSARTPEDDEMDRRAAEKNAELDGESQPGPSTQHVHETAPPPPSAGTISEPQPALDATEQIAVQIASDVMREVTDPS